MKNYCILLVLLAALVASQEHVQCTWSTKTQGTGKEKDYDVTYSLAPMSGYPFSIKDSDNSRNFTYYFNVCGRLEREINPRCPKTTDGRFYAAYQVSGNGAYCYNLVGENLNADGVINWSLIDASDPSVGISYTYAQGSTEGECKEGRSLKLNLYCQDYSEMPSEEAVLEGPICTYNLDIFNSYGCPVQCAQDDNRLCGGRGFCGYDDNSKTSKCFCDHGYYGDSCNLTGNERLIISSTSKILIVICAILLLIEIGVGIMWGKVKNLRLDPEAYANLNSEKMGMIENLGD